MVLFPLLCQAVLVFVRLWSLVLFSIFLVLLFVFIRLLYVVLFPLFCCAVVCCFVRLWSLFWSCFLLIFGYGCAVAEALRLWFFFVLFLLSLLGGVVALLRTRLLFVYFFISSFVCFFYLFLRCFSGLCLLSLSGGSGRTTCFFFVRSRFVIIFRLCFWFCVFCLFLLCLKFSGCGFFCLVFALFAWLRFW